MQRSTRGFHDLKQVCKPLTLLSVWLTCLTGENISNKSYLKLTKYFALIAEKIFWQIILSNSSFIFISHTQKNAIEDRDKVRNPLLFSSLPTKTKWRLLRSSRSPSGRLSCRANCPPPLQTKQNGGCCGVPVFLREAWAGCQGVRADRSLHLLVQRQEEDDLNYWLICLLSHYWLSSFH